MKTTKPTFFPTPAAMRAGLTTHHEKEQELWIGFYKKSSGRPSVTWAESVDAALCFGWIDGIRKRLDEQSYVIRFTPRKPASNWSTININRVRELTKLRLMHPAGIAAFERRNEDKSRAYSYERVKVAKLGAAYERRFRTTRGAWEFFRAQAPSYQRMASYWVASAKQEETRLKRLARLIEASARRRRI